MNNLRAGYFNEIDKIFIRRKYQVLLVLSGIATLGVSLVARLANNIINVSISNLPLTILSLATLFALPLVMFMLVADLFTAEQENGVIKATITRPVSPNTIFFAKVLAILSYVATILGACLVVSAGFAMAISGMSPQGIWDTFISYISSMVPMLAILLFSIAISQLVKSSSATAILSVFGYAVLIGIGQIIPKTYQILFTSYTGWYKLFIGTHMPFMAIVKVTMLLFAYILVFFAAGGTLFAKKEY